MPRLDLSACGLSGTLEWGDGILAALLELIVDDNAIDALPDTLPARAPRLKRLSLERNRVTSIPAAVLESPTLDRLDLKGNPGLTKAAFLQLPGVEAFLDRRQKTRSKDIAGGALGDLGVCGLD
mmetsp:Transcript_23769/g.94231  ORF Transcript_23769/g.94231 Transcript_23769/m.94231 type:complete len:124 (-) Transcript_23769:2195-2566(-)